MFNTIFTIAIAIAAAAAQLLGALEHFKVVNAGVSPWVVLHLVLAMLLLIGGVWHFQTLKGNLPLFSSVAASVAFLTANLAQALWVSSLAIGAPLADKPLYLLGLLLFVGVAFCHAHAIFVQKGMNRRETDAAKAPRLSRR